MSWIGKIVLKMRLSDANRVKVIWSLASALYWVIFLWGFWGRGPAALGANAFVYLVLTGALFVWTMKLEGMSLNATGGGWCRWV